MQATLSNCGRHVVLSLTGPIDFETPQHFETQIRKLFRGRSIDNILINMENLDFVGSSGIEKFMSILERTFGSSVRCIGTKKEFKRCFHVFSDGNNQFQYYSSVEEAIADFDSETPGEVQAPDAIQSTMDC